MQNGEVIDLSTRAKVRSGSPSMTAEDVTMLQVLAVAYGRPAALAILDAAQKAGRSVCSMTRDIMEDGGPSFFGGPYAA